MENGSYLFFNMKIVTKLHIFPQSTMKFCQFLRKSSVFALSKLVKVIEKGETLGLPNIQLDAMEGVLVGEIPKCEIDAEWLQSDVFGRGDVFVCEILAVLAE